MNRRVAIRFLIFLVNISATWTSAEDTPPLDRPTLDRGHQIHTALLNALDRSYAADGVWPDHISVPPGITYTKPPRFALSWPDSGMASTAMVLQEDFTN